VCPVQAAASDAAGEADFFAGAPEAPETGSMLRPGAAGTACKVRTVRLDELCLSRGFLPDVVKIDVEGHEVAVLAGMATLFEGGLPRAIMVETHGFMRPAKARQLNDAVHRTLAAHFERVLRKDGDAWRPLEAAPAWREREHLLARGRR
jgi:hypothetical protein